MKFYLGTVIAFALTILPWSGVQAEANTIGIEKFKMTGQESGLAQYDATPVEEKEKADPPGGRGGNGNRDRNGNAVQEGAT